MRALSFLQFFILLAAVNAITNNPVSGDEKTHLEHRSLPRHTRDPSASSSDFDFSVPQSPPLARRWGGGGGGGSGSGSGSSGSSSNGGITPSLNQVNRTSPNGYGREHGHWHGSHRSSSSNVTRPDLVQTSITSPKPEAPPKSSTPPAASSASQASVGRLYYLLATGWGLALFASYSANFAASLI